MNEQLNEIFNKELNDQLNNELKEQLNKELNEVLSNSNPPKTRIDDDGIEVKWDEEKKAWFPNIDEEFIYKHNLNYGFVAEEIQPEAKPEPIIYPDGYLSLWNEYQDICKSGNIDLTNLPSELVAAKFFKFYSDNIEKYRKKEMKALKRPAKANNPTWFEVEEDQNKHIYVENLPLDIKQEEFVELVSKYGLLMYQPFTNTPKAKLYEDEEGKVKGDGICCYLKVESVELALNLLDGINLRGCIVKVSRAKFELKGDFDPKKRRRITNKEKRKIQKHQDSLFRWGPETKAVRPKKDNTVILKNVFDIEMMKENPEMAFDIKERVNKETKNIGAFKSIMVHDLHPDAVVQINFHDPNFSDIAVEYFNNKIWNGRNVTAEIWDGKTKYKVKETAEEEKTRLEKWEQTLEGKKIEENKEQLIIESGNDENESLENLVKALGGDEETLLIEETPMKNDSIEDNLEGQNAEDIFNEKESLPIEETPMKNDSIEDNLEINDKESSSIEETPMKNDSIADNLDGQNAEDIFSEKESLPIEETPMKNDSIEDNLEINEKESSPIEETPMINDTIAAHLEENDTVLQDTEMIRDLHDS